MVAMIAKSLEQRSADWTHLFKVVLADLSVGFSNKQITLLALVDGDLVKGAMIDVRTLVTGPTGAPTAQVKASAVAITPTVAVKTAKYGVTDNTIVGSTTATSSVNLVLDLQVGGGDGAAGTAGEIWVWAQIQGVKERDIQA